MSSKLIIPILNKSVKTFKGPTWYLTDDLWIGRISQAEYELFQNPKYDIYHHLLNKHTKCIHILNFNKLSEHTSIIDEISKISFLLNYFTNSNPVALSFGIIFLQKRILKLQSIFDLPLLVDSKSMGPIYNIGNKISRKTTSEFLTVINVCCQKNQNLLLTLSRFNAALSKPEASWTVL